MSNEDLKPGEESFPEPAHLDATFVRLSGSQDNQANFYYNMNQTGQEETPALPPGMSPDQAAPPETLSVDPEVSEEIIVEEETPEQ